MNVTLTQTLRQKEDQLQNLENDSNLAKKKLQELEEEQEKKKIEQEKEEENGRRKINGMKDSCLPVTEMEVLKQFMMEEEILQTNTLLSSIYVGSINGFSASDFHRMCDGKKDIIVLIKANDYYFGGYSPIAYQSR